MVHSYLIDHYMPNWSFLSRYMYGDCYKVVCITNESKALIERKHHLKNVVRIYNPIDNRYYCKSKVENELNMIILWRRPNGNQHQVDKLIEAYAISILPTKNIHLVLLGDTN
jgi:N-acetylgalactosamine-N,N'-diacetylbacillosaminyl-diphospho-undecaprenol 4-alpha-N-acetylgalactosaminyltransferase